MSQVECRHVGVLLEHGGIGAGVGSRLLALAGSEWVTSAAMRGTETDSRPGDWAKLGKLIRDIKVALLTTVDVDGHFHSRPVQTLQLEGEDTLWYFTDWSSPKVQEMQRDVRVALSYADPHQHSYVAVSGSSTLLRDPNKAKEIWSIEQRAYYPDGPEDRRLALLRVRIEHAEYWIAPGRTSYLLAAAKAVMTGIPVGVIGENRKLE